MSSPLTDEWIRKHWFAGPMNTTLNDYIKIVRLVEAVHGIKEK